MGDINVTIGGDSVSVSVGTGDVSVQTGDNNVNSQAGSDSVQATIGDDDVSINFGQQIPIKDRFRRKTFIGDGTNQTITLDGNTARAGSILVLFSGIPGELDVDYTVASDRKSITFLNNFKTGRKGEIRYVLD